MNEIPPRDGWQLVGMNCRVSTLKLFYDSLNKYRSKLAPHHKENNKTIKEEIDRIDGMLSHISSLISKYDDDGDYYLTELHMRRMDYERLHDVFYKYYTGKKAKLRLQEATNNVKGALEAEEQEIKNIEEVLNGPFFQDLDRSSALVDDLQDVDNQAVAKIEQQITIGNLYGQLVAGNNYGTMKQENNSELISLLQSLFDELVVLETISEQVKNNAIGDIQTMQAQAMKNTPDRTILERAREGLSVLADSLQVGQFAVVAAPYIQKIDELIKAVLG